MPETHGIRRWLPAILLLFACPVVATAPADPLWLKGVGIAASSEGWTPGLMKIQIEELDRKGAVDELREEWTRLELAEDGTVRSRTVKILVDGEELTEEEAPESGVSVGPSEGGSAGEPGAEDDGSGGSASVSAGDTPLAPGNQQRVEASRIVEKKTLQGRDCVGFAFTMTGAADQDDAGGRGDEKSEDGVRGTAWLAADDGTPLEIQWVPEPLPKHVKKMEQTERYSTGEDGWQLRSMDMEIQARFLLFRKHLRMHLTFEQYWLTPPSEDTPQNH